MKTVNKCARQGDVLVRRVAKVPDGFALVPRNGPVVVAHSETGHNHVVGALDVKHFEDAMKPLVCYLQMGDSGVCDLEHLRSFDTHETLSLLGDPGDVWECRRQREHTPEGWRRAQD